MAATEATSAAALPHFAATGYEKEKREMSAIFASVDKKTKQEVERRPAVRSRQEMVPTARDREIIRWVFAAGVATREQVQQLFFTTGGRSRCQQRLTLLYGHRYLDRLQGRPRSAQAVYYLSRRANRGLQLLRYDEPAGTVRPKSIHAALIEHQLKINDCRIAFLRSCAAADYEMPLWLGEDELAQPMGSTGVVPDAYFQVLRATGEGERRASFFLEVERSAKPDRALAEKFRRYGEFYYSGRYEREFGVKGLRVLFLVGDDYGIHAERRVEKLASICAKQEVTIFRFAPLAEFLAQDVSHLLFAGIWRPPGEEELSALFER